MSETPAAPEELTPLEVAETEATIRKLHAEASAAEQEARWNHHRAEKSEKEARLAALQLETVEHETARMRTDDLYHHVYRFGGTVNAKSVGECMSQLTEWHRLDPERPIELVFFSPGGSIDHGLALYDFIQDLKEAGTPVSTGTFGMAASMAGVLLQAGGERWASPNSWILIHRASFGAMGSAHEIEDTVELVKRMEERLVAILCERSNLTPDEVKAKWDRRDWWLTGEEALELGLVDKLRGVIE